LPTLPPASGILGGVAVDDGIVAIPPRTGSRAERRGRIRHRAAAARQPTMPPVVARSPAALKTSHARHVSQTVVAAKASELCDRSRCQLGGFEIPILHPPAQATEDLQRVADGAGHVTRLRQPHSVTRDERFQPTRLPPRSRHDSPPSRSTLLRHRKPPNPLELSRPVRAVGVLVRSPRLALWCHATHDSA
jgi:hypothetical protein